MTKYTVKIEKTPESIVAAIRFFEMEFGESYLEYQDFFVDASIIMKFAYEKGYITEEKFNFWKEGFNDNEQGAQETFEVIFSDDEEWEPYCITYMDESIDKDYNEQYSDSLLVYGELVCSDDTYYNKFVDTFKSKTKGLVYVEVIDEENKSENNEETEDEVEDESL